jgi:hypothetical protein
MVEGQCAVRAHRIECEARRHEAEEAISQLRSNSAGGAGGAAVEAQTQTVADARMAAAIAAAEARAGAAEAAAGSRQAEVLLLQQALVGAQAQLVVTRRLAEGLQSKGEEVRAMCSYPRPISHY